jgi:hypothetical protein
MPLRTLLEGEGRLLGFLGANAGFEGLHVAVTNKLDHLMPMLTNLLTVAQLAIAGATFVYMILKIRKVLRKKNE